MKLTTKKGVTYDRFFGDEPEYKVCPGCGCTHRNPGSWCGDDICSHNFWPNIAKNAPLEIRAIQYEGGTYYGRSPIGDSNIIFPIRGATCPNWGTPDCAKCQPFIEFKWQLEMDFGCELEKVCDGGYEGCLDCPYNEESCPCFDLSKVPFKQLEMKGVK